MALRGDLQQTRGELAAASELLVSKDEDLGRAHQLLFDAANERAELRRQARALPVDGADAVTLGTYNAFLACYLPRTTAFSAHPYHVK